MRWWKRLFLLKTNYTGDKTYSKAALAFGLDTTALSSLMRKGKSTFLPYLIKAILTISY